MKTLATVLGLCLILISTSNYGMENGGFVTGSAGWTKIENDGIEFEDTNIAYKLGGGYVFTRYFALEGYYVDYGKAEANADDDNNPTTSKIDVSLEPFSFVIQAVGIIPIGSMLDLFGKAGFSFWTNDITYKGANTVRDDGIDAIFGLGGSVNITNNFALRAEMEVGQYDDTDVSMLSAGVSYHFN